jgi:EF hand
MRQLTTLTGIALALGLAAAPAMAQDWDAWDANGDGILDTEEFASGFGENDVYGSWDADQDGMLSEDEFNEGVFGSYDADDSGAIEEPEYGDLGDDMGDGGLWDV